VQSAGVRWALVTRPRAARHMSVVAACSQDATAPEVVAGSPSLSFFESFFES
jgi:hypothetical protein